MFFLTNISKFKYLGSSSRFLKIVAGKSLVLGPCVADEKGMGKGKTEFVGHFLFKMLPLKFEIS